MSASISKLVLQLQIMSSVAILGPICDVGFYIRNSWISTQKCSTREKSREIMVNAKIRGLREFVIFV